MQQQNTTKTVLETIFDWSIDRPLWQSDALRRIITKGRIENSDIKELADLCKCYNLKSDQPDQSNPLTKDHLPATLGKYDSVALHSISDVKEVNCLASNQILNFEPNGITVIYGNNGTGKSGYVRILKQVCKARHLGKILSNIYAESDPPAKASATITYILGNKLDNPEVCQDINQPHPILSAVNVFDSDCAAIHLNEENEVTFRPFGLHIPDELANICQQVKGILNSELEQLKIIRNPLFSRPPWKESTKVGNTIASLKYNTKMESIEALATLNQTELSQLKRLKEDLSKDPVKAAAEQDLKANNINRLIIFIKHIANETSDSKLSKLFDLYNTAKNKREIARIAAENVFSNEPLPGVGEEIWRSLWESARKYSYQVAYPGHDFPHTHNDARCILCQQLLSEDATNRLKRFEEFIQNDSEKQAKIADEESNKALQELLNLKINTRSMQINLQEIALQNPELAQEIIRFIAVLRLRRYKVKKNLSGASLALPIPVQNPIESLQQFEATIRHYSTKLKQSAEDEGQERKKFEIELAELEDRIKLHENLQAIRDEVARLKKIQHLTQCLATTSTTSVTKLGNDIADTVITPKLRDRFQEEIVKLAADKVRAEIVRSGGKYGSPHYQVRLFAKPKEKVKLILSEGEQTCIALAAFLTELATSTHNSALVFDDPVNSLDHRWRKQVANRLVDESSKRQVIVFTHDLIFVNDLIEIADTNKQRIKSITVSREADGTGVVTDELPWIIKSVEDRIDKLEKTLTNIKILYQNHDEEQYAIEVSGIYNQLRATWERALEDIAFNKVILRHRDYINSKNLKKVTVLNETDCDQYSAGFKKCCDIVDAHDPSRGRNFSPPNPEEIKRDIDGIKTWVSGLRDRQKLK